VERRELEEDDLLNKPKIIQDAYSIINGTGIDSIFGSPLDPTVKTMIVNSNGKLYIIGIKTEGNDGPSGT
jgi:hypothetical protein